MAVGASLAKHASRGKIVSPAKIVNRESLARSASQRRPIN